MEVDFVMWGSFSPEEFLLRAIDGTLGIFNAWEVFGDAEFTGDNILVLTVVNGKPLLRTI
jgi:hypothetical protein